MEVSSSAMLALHSHVPLGSFFSSIQRFIMKLIVATVENQGPLKTMRVSGLPRLTGCFTEEFPGRMVVEFYLYLEKKESGS